MFICSLSRLSSRRRFCQWRRVARMCLGLAVLYAGVKILSLGSKTQVFGVKTLSGPPTSRNLRETAPKYRESG